MSYSEIEEIALTQRLVQIESTDPGVGEGAVARFVCEWLSRTGAEVARESVFPGRDNIVATLKGGDASHNLVYICHMDTVPIGAGWTCDPFAAEIRDGKIYGRGSCDMKSGLASAMIAFREIARSGAHLKHDFKFIATVDEEFTMKGADQAVRGGHITRNSYVLDAEPTNGLIKASHKGKVWFRLSSRGVTAHASTPELGSDAVAAMAEIISAINRRTAALPPHEEMGRASAVFAGISGGSDTYIVPDSCTATVDMRIVPPVTEDQAIELVRDSIREGCAKVPGTSCEVEVTARRPYIERNEDSYLLAKLRAATERVTGKRARTGFFPGYTDTAVASALTGCRDCMSYGPGDLALAHKPDEYVPCEDITRCTRVMTELAKSILIEGNN